MILEVFFWVSCLSVFHSYVVFPYILKVLSAGKKQNQLVFSRDEELPDVYVMMAVFNAENILDIKLKSLLENNYPGEKLHFYIGSDNSSDNTDSILREFSAKDPRLNVRYFNQRTGKANIINAIYEEIKSELPFDSILLLTDVYAVLTPDAIFTLVKHFKNHDIGLVGSNIINGSYKKEGISYQEKAYFEREILMKYQEGLIWGSSIGAFGACYAIRTTQFHPIPKNFLVDDFYITFKVLENGFKAIYELDAVCYLDVPNDPGTEYNRKVRISAGNFQNLNVFLHMLWPPFNGTAFAFLSHKVIRWLTPFFIFICYICSFALSFRSEFYGILFILQSLLFLTPIIEKGFRKMKIHNKLLKFVAHFYLMNLGILVGFIKYTKGIESNVWKPTQRPQTNA